MPDVGPARVELRGLRILGRHGVLAEERLRAQPFELDVDLVFDVGVAAESDDLADTVDYAAVVAAATRVVEGEHCRLLERLVVRVGEAVLELDTRVEHVTVVLRKLRPPVPADLGSAGVRVTISR
ncbi:MAG TPA: dihydroneopterin aldolase [Acidimicrobiales bacterium]|nr:dihydroneopterin aldolase [Acidimicrobiales bacterium]